MIAKVGGELIPIFLNLIGFSFEVFNGEPILKYLIEDNPQGPHILLQRRNISLLTDFGSRIVHGHAPLELLPLFGFQVVGLCEIDDLQIQIPLDQYILRFEIPMNHFRLVN